MEQFLKDMKQAGIKMVAATSSDRQVVERALERLNVMVILTEYSHVRK
ncbi:MAG: hypothetical protein ACOX7R_10800 [Acetivibrionales bacterium]